MSAKKLNWQSIRVYFKWSALFFNTLDAERKRLQLMLIIKRFTISIVLSMFMFSAIAQEIVLNEVVSSNSKFFDEDGDSPDWFELHNTTANPISLEEWTITDNEDNPAKWTFPAVTIGPDDYLYIWASGKDKRQVNTPRTLIDRNDNWNYIIPPQPVTLNWINLDYDDSNWFTGQSGFGYADNDDVTTIPAGTSSVFMRNRFTVADKNKIDELILDIDYDDAFVAYINGVEVARANIQGDRPDYNDYSITDHEAQIYSGGRPDRFLVSSDVLQDGENVLSIQAHNVSDFSSDFTLIPFLSALYSSSTNEGIDPPAILNLSQRTAHTNFKLSNGETLFLFDANGNEIDQLYIENTPPDVSLGHRMQDDILVFFDPPTPGEKNEGDGYEGYLIGEIEFSHPGGVVNDFDLTLSGGEPQDVIRYTLDATIPDSNSPSYQNPISIDESTVVRARIFRNGSLPSNTESRTYLMNVSHDIPIVSLVTDPDNLFDNDTGIYELGDNYEDNFPFFGANFWEDWERQINFTLYENDNSVGVNFDAGIKIFGGWSRAQEQRSFSIFARGEYGTSEIDYPLFPTNSYDKYQALVLRNSGNDFLRSNIRDIMLTSLMDGSGIETQAYRSVATYINGDYWGQYNMREKINEHYLASRHNVNPDDVDLMGPGGELIHGDDTEYVELQDYLWNNSLVSDSKYQFVADQIDIENFVIYNIAQIYFNNTDWPGNNIKYWKVKGGKWRWILYDTDFGFGPWNPNSFNNNTLAFALDPNGPAWPNPPASTLTLRRLVENEQFRHQFINQFADELNSRFLPSRVEEHIINIATDVQLEMVKHFNRWDGSIDFHNDQIDVMTDYAKFRHPNVKAHIRNVFGLPAFHTLSLQINNPSAGYIKVNSLISKTPYWQGDYYENVPIKITAVAKSGYVFSHWTGDSNSTDSELIIDMKSAMTLNAIFEASTEEQTVVINEINYNSLEINDAGDWIELYNPSDNIIDLSDWVFTDSDIEGGYLFPSGTTISGKGFLIVARDIMKFEMQNSEVEHLVGNFGFGLSSSGDDLRIYNSTQTLIDSVQYDSSDPWPEMADGLGYTLELKAPNLNNALAENWASINPQGSPGKKNSETTSITEESENEELKVFPNPFSNKTTIELSLLQPSNVNITLINAQGIFIKSIYAGSLNAGNHKFVNDFDKLSRGVYYLQCEFGDKVETIKWLKI